MVLSIYEDLKRSNLIYIWRESPELANNEQFHLAELAALRVSATKNLIIKLKFNFCKIFGVLPAANYGLLEADFCALLNESPITDF